MLKSSLCNYIDVYTLAKGKITITGAGDKGGARKREEINKRVIFKNCAPFTASISQINNTQIDNAHYLDNVMPMHNFIEYDNN